MHIFTNGVLVAGDGSVYRESKIDSHFYHHFGATLANEGFVVYAPQNPYIGDDRFRIIQRIGHPLKLALFSFILGQHEQTLNWLASLPFVDPGESAFTASLMAAKLPSACRPCSINMLSRYARGTLTSGFGRRPMSLPRRATC